MFRWLTLARSCGMTQGSSGGDAAHMIAVTQLRNLGTEGRISFDRKVAEGKTNKEALRA